MRDISNRLLLLPKKHPVSSSSYYNDDENDNNPKRIMIVSSDASRSFKEIQEIKDNTLAATTSTTLRETLIKRRGYKIGDSFMIDALLNKHQVMTIDDEAEDYNLDDNNQHLDIHLLVLDSQSTGDEDDVMSPKVTRIIHENNLRYGIFRIAAVNNNDDDHNPTQMFGLTTAKLFLNAGYNLQVLSSSHVHNGINPYGPNTLLKDIGHVQEFLLYGSNLVRSYTTTSANSTTDDSGSVFQSYLFVTLGSELAIPSRKEYLDMLELGNDHVIDTRDYIPFRKCPSTKHNEANIVIQPSKKLVEITCFGQQLIVKDDDTKANDDQRNHHTWNKTTETFINAEIWFSHSNISMSEAACVKCIKKSRGDYKSIRKTSCATHIKPSLPMPITDDKHDKYTTVDQIDSRILNDESNNNQNVLAINLLGVNQRMANESLTSFQSLRFTSFPNYVGIQSSFPVLNHSLTTKFLRQGYHVFQSSTMCRGKNNKLPENNMIYGSQLDEMFCFDHDLPSCLGGRSKASLLFDASKQFIDRRLRQREKWAALLTIEAGEETNTLVGTLDLRLTQFLSGLKKKMSPDEWSKTMIIVFSDNVKESPILFVKTTDSCGSAIRENQQMYTTPVDLFETLQRVHGESSLVDAEIYQESSPGRPLTLKLPTERSRCDSITELHGAICNGVASNSNETIKPESELPAPPSILSFYADIPQKHKFQLPVQQVEGTPQRAELSKGCLCSTNVRPWFICENTHPWELGGDTYVKEYFLLAHCPNKQIHLEIRMLPNDTLMKRSKSKRELSGLSNTTNVNVLFLELDSVSREYADRHFPKTRELLKRYRLQQRQNHYECRESMCSADFSFVSLAGANSIPNQVAALSGCISTSTDKKNMCGVSTNGTLGEVCKDAHAVTYGFRLERIRLGAKEAYWCPQRNEETVKTPWIFGVTDSKGYVNYFGEEFCYENSPYVTQGTLVYCCSNVSFGENK
jgi:hypothetical protein